MIAGLLFAIHDADDRPGSLTATLPFGGTTLIEYQARLLIGAGASQIVIMVARLTPELIGALTRIGRRGVAVDTVRSAAEAAAALHPLARVVMLADGLTTNDETVAAMAHEGGDALLVLGEGDATGSYERIGGGMLWGGIARLDARRLTELAALPRDYDVQSTLIRLASQARAVHVMLPPAALRGGHGIEHGGTTLEARGRGVLAALLARKGGWTDRLVVAPLARLAIPALVRRAVPTVALCGGAGALQTLALALVWFDHALAGVLAGVAGSILWSLAAILSDLRDEAAVARFSDLAGWVGSALIVLAYGHRAALLIGDGSPRIAAIGLIVAAVLGEQAAERERRDWWWGSAVAYLLIVLVGTILSVSLAGLLAAWSYAAVVAFAAIGRTRQQA